MSSPELDGDGIVRTRVALQRMGDEYPFVGELEIMAANNAVIILIALDSQNVRLEIDVDGDGGSYDTIDMTWEELTGQAPAA